MVPLAAACDTRLTELGYRILGAIASFANSDESWAAWPTFYVIADMVDCDKDSVGRWVGRLVEYGYLIPAPTKRRKLRWIVATAERSPALPPEFDRRLRRARSVVEEHKAEPATGRVDSPESDRRVDFSTRPNDSSAGNSSQESATASARILPQGRNDLVFSRRSAAAVGLTSVPSTPWHAKDPDERRKVYRSWLDARDEVMLWFLDLDLPEAQETAIWDSAPPALVDPSRIRIPVHPRRWDEICAWWIEATAPISAPPDPLSGSESAS